MNSAPSRFVVQNYIVLHPDTHIRERVCIPEYASINLVHNQLASCSQQAHKATSEGDTGRVKETEAEIDRLTDGELKEIQESLAELG